MKRRKKTSGFWGFKTSYVGFCIAELTNLKQVTSCLPYKVGHTLQLERSHSE